MQSECEVLDKDRDVYVCYRRWFARREGYCFSTCMHQYYFHMYMYTDTHLLILSPTHTHTPHTTTPTPTHTLPYNVQLRDKTITPRIAGKVNFRSVDIADTEPVVGGRTVVVLDDDTDNAY